MAHHDLVVLPDDLKFTPVRELPLAERRALEAKSDDYVVYRPRSRSWMKLVSATGVELLREFREPVAVMDAIDAHSRKRGADPQRVLQDAFPLIRTFVQEQLLVPADSPQNQRVEPSLAPYEEVGSLVVQSCIHVSSDTELYLARDDADNVYALKVVRTGSRRGRSLIAQEAAALESAAGLVSPRLIEYDSQPDRPFLVMEWRPGAHADVLARDYREQTTRGARRQLLDLCVAIVKGYGRLHAAGVVHGDVHPRNVLVDRFHSVTILDYEFARITSQPPAEDVVRGGVGYYFEPEYASAVLRGDPDPHPTERGEQYSLAALLYFLLTGKHYLDFSPHRTKLLAQIAADPPHSFAARQVRAWPGVEVVLAKALNKDPAERFESLRGFADALQDVRVPHTSERLENGFDRKHRFVERFIDHLGLESALIGLGLELPPTASVNDGAAGVAYGLYRMACSRDDASLLAAANLWLVRSNETAYSEDGFRHPGQDRDPLSDGSASLYHSACGLSIVDATLGRAEGDAERMLAGVHSFIEASQTHGALLDLTLGRASTLLGCAVLAELTINEAPEELESLGMETLTQLEEKLTGEDLQGPHGLNLGIAHGWAGVVYATLRWCAATAGEPPEFVEVCLADLSRRAERWGRGLRWQWLDGASGNNRGVARHMPGWCNGTAGLVHLWILAHHFFRDDGFLDLADGSAWNAWEGPGPEVFDLCCGLSGRAYSLLAYYRHTDDREWLVRAHRLADRAIEAVNADISGNDHSLYRGGLGVAALVADLDRPDDAAMPFFESERWPSPMGATG